MPNLNSRDPRLVAAILYEPLCTFEFSIAAEIFGLARPEFGDDWYRFVTVSETPEPVSANGGIHIAAEKGLAALGEAGMIILPGWHTDETPPPQALSAALTKAEREGARIVSICSGAFLLAALGMLDGRRAATHWVYAQKLRERFPAVIVDADVLFVADGHIYTSAGSAAGIDLCMHIVREDWGVAKANTVARRMVMPAHRDGDQRQFIPTPMPKNPGGRLHALIENLRSTPRQRWNVDEMAHAAAMSRRTFIRKFRQATERTPAEFLLGVRLDLARSLLENGQRSMERIAAEAGFGSLATMQHHFRTRLGCTPSEYRRRFS